MRAFPLSPASACIAIAALAAPITADSATTDGYIFVQGASCQLSVPTTNTAFRPKASGARNESTSVSNFIICPFTVSPSSSAGAPITSLVLHFATLDSVSRAVNCTAVVGDNVSVTPQYSTKTVTTPAGTFLQSTLFWTAGDFGGTAGDPIIGSAFLSVTCNMPPQSSLVYLYATYAYEIGA